jgi:hypothetical protein
MARSIGMAAGAKVYRAAITKKYSHSELPFTVYEGPYGDAAAAKGRVTFWKNHLGTRKLGATEWAEGHVEEGEVTWTPKP